jgi:hypothetical protein
MYSLIAHASSFKKEKSTTHASYLFTFLVDIYLLYERGLHFFSCIAEFAHLIPHASSFL